MELKLKTCSVRPWRRGDEESLAANANNYKIWRNVRDQFPRPYTLDNARDWVGLAGRESPPTNFALVVDGNAVGGIGLVFRNDINSCRAEIGYWLGEAYWGRGIVSEAVRALTARTGDGGNHAIANDADSMIAAVTNKEIACGIEFQIGRGKQFGLCRRAAIARETSAIRILRRAKTCDGLNCAINRDATNATVGCIADENAAVASNHDGHRQIDLRFGRRAAVASVAGNGSSDRRDNAAAIHSANDVVVSIGNQQAAFGVKSNALWIVQRSRRRRSIIACQFRLAVSSNGRDNAELINAPNALVVSVGNQQIAVGIEQQIVRRVKLCFRRQSAVAAKSSVASSGNNDQAVSRIQPEYLMRSDVRNEQLSFSIERQSVRKV